MKRIKQKIKKGDFVVVITGNDKDLSKPKVVKRVYAQENKAIVEGVKMISRHTKPNAQNTKGQIVKKEAPIHLSNLMLWDAKAKTPTKVKIEKGEDGKIKRISKKSGEII